MNIDKTTSIALPPFTNGYWYQDTINHRLIQLEYNDEAKALVALLTTLKEELLALDIEEKSKIKRWTTGHNRILKLIVLNAFVRSKTLGDRSNILIYWGEDYFNKGNYYSDKLNLSVASTHAVINGLYKLGYLYKKTGTSGRGIRDNGSHYPLKLGTRVKPTEKFAEILDNKLSIESFSYEDDASVTFKRHKNDDNKAVYTLKGSNVLSAHNQRKVRQPALRRFNKLIQQTVFQVANHTYFAADTRFERQFIANWQSYGRYHCHRLQNMPSELRPYLLMDGEPTVEIDIVSSNILMAYASKGIDLSLREPAYALAGIPCDKHGSSEARENRKLLKQALLILINTSNKGNTRNAARAILNWSRGTFNEALTRLSEALYKAQNKPIDLLEDDYESMAIAVTDALAVKHNEIKDFIESTTSGKGLMYQESEVISEVIDHFTKKGIPCLPIHDSVLVPQSHETELRDTLINKIESRFNIKFSNTDKVVEIEHPKFIETEAEARKVMQLIVKGYHDEKSKHFVRYEWNAVHIQGSEDNVSEFVL